MKIVNIKFIISFIALVSILITFFILVKPIFPKVLEYKEYKIVTQFNNRRKPPPLFLDERVNKRGLHAFFIHPGKKLDSNGKFIFNNSCNLVLRFSIKEGSKIGDIEFKIKKNNNTYKKFVINSKNNKIFKLNFDKNDTLTIIANNHGDMAGDWGYLEIWHNDIYLYITLLALWIIYIILLLSKENLYIATISLLLFIITIYSYTLHFGKIEFESIMVTSIYIMLLGVGYAIIKTIKNRVIKPIFAISISIILLLSFLISIAYLIYFLTITKSVTKEILDAIYETNLIETYEYINNNISIEYILYTLVFIVLFILLTFKNFKNQSIKFSNFFTVLTLTILSIITITDVAQIAIFGNVFISYSEFKKELEAFKEVKKSRKFSQENLKVIKKESGETYIVVIGESLNKYHMSLYGYFRDTTPNLKKIDNLIKFDIAYSNHVHTSLVLTYALTEANQYNKKIFWNTPSIINILNAANFDTYWVTNQILYSKWDNKISALATDAKKVIPLNSSRGVRNRNIITTNYDGELTEKVKKILDKNSSHNRVIFVHLMGNHVKYSARYPKEFEKYKNRLKAEIFGKDTSKVDDLNAYDNAVYYNDYVVSSILKLLKSKNSVTGFIYLSDHADDVDKLGHLAHNVNKFTFDITQIPMIAWFGKKYIDRYKERYNTLLERKESLFSNDLLYDTLIGIMNLKTKFYNPLYDLSSNKYKISSKNALVLHGKIRYSDSKNRFFWLNENLKFLKSKNLLSKLYIYTNSVAKINILNKFGYINFIINNSNSPKECFVSKDKLFEKESSNLQESKLFNYLKDKDRSYILSCLNKEEIINIENSNWDYYINQIMSKKYRAIKSNISKYNDLKERLLPYINKKITLILDLQNSIGTNRFINELKKYNFNYSKIILTTKYKSNYDN